MTVSTPRCILHGLNEALWVLTEFGGWWLFGGVYRIFMEKLPGFVEGLVELGLVAGFTSDFLEGARLINRDDIAISIALPLDHDVRLWLDQGCKHTWFLLWRTISSLDLLLKEVDTC